MPRKGSPLCGQWGLLSLLGKEAPSEPGFSVVSAQSGNDRKSDVALTASSLQVPDAMALSVPFQEGLLTQKGFGEEHRPWSQTVWAQISALLRTRLGS